MEGREEWKEISDSVRGVEGQAGYNYSRGNQTPACMISGRRKVILHQSAQLSDGAQVPSDVSSVRVGCYIFSQFYLE